MLMGLTRQLGGALLLCGLLFSVGARAAETQPALSSEEQARYLSELKRLYMTSDERKALFAHANSLLSTYALSAGYQVGQTDRRDLRYQLSLARPGELMLREETRAANGTELGGGEAIFLLPVVKDAATDGEADAGGENGHEAGPEKPFGIWYFSRVGHDLVVGFARWFPVISGSWRGWQAP